jgi:alkylated DNA repair dioxygenase AlkB
MLFPADPTSNLLPADGRAHYFGPVLSMERADQLLHNFLTEIPWAHDEVVMFGKPITTARAVAWFGDTDDSYSYSYSGTTKQAHHWTPALLELKRLVEQLTHTTYNSCLMNLYHHGQEGMGWHSDDEKSLAHHGTIASVSLGAERKFNFKHKRTGETISLMLEHGSLLIMAGACQTHWLHCLPKTTRIQAPRVNLTFRTIQPPGNIVLSADPT